MQETRSDPNRFPLARALGLWLVLVATESVHGILRRLVLEPRIGDLRARQVSVFTGASLIVLVFRMTLPWMGPQSARRWWRVGILWLGMTLVFEVGLGRVTGCHGIASHPTSTRDAAACWRSA